MIRVQDLRLKAALVRRRAPSRLFLRGPVTWSWIERAAVLPGKALHVALATQLLVGMCGERRVRLGPKYLRRMGVSRHASYRALVKLESAGLVSAKRRRGRSPEVTVIDGSLSEDGTLPHGRAAGRNAETGTR